MRTPDQRLIVKVQEPVTAELVLKTPSQQRPPTDDELFDLGYVSRDWLYERMKSMIQRLGEDSDERPLSLLRYFCECIAIYHHEPPEDAIEGMRVILATCDWPKE